MKSNKIIRFIHDPSLLFSGFSDNGGNFSYVKKERSSFISASINFTLQLGHDVPESNNNNRSTRYPFVQQFLKTAQ